MTQKQSWKIISVGILALFPTLCYAQLDGSAKYTPLGAERAGNAEGTIPEWDGGITKSPANYVKGKKHTDPFAQDKVLFSVSAENLETYKDQLTEGQIALLQKYPDYKLNIYKTRRSASYPDRVYTALEKNKANAHLKDLGNAVGGAKVTSPFPAPQNGLQAIWNHLLRFRGDKITRKSGQVNPTTSGSYTMIKFKESLYFNYTEDDFGERDNTFLYFNQTITEPPRLAGEILLVHETLNQVKEPRHAWTYNPGQRRVRRAPNVAYDNPGTASDGLRTNDQLDIYNGAPDRYEWTLLGKKEIYVPYNAYKIHSDKLDYDKIIKAGHLNPDYLRYELHRVWVVDAKLKKGTSHIYSRRTLYLDEDSWQILVADHYDSRGNIWRVGEAHPINYYEVPVLWTTLEISYDLQSGRYTANGFDNEDGITNFEAKLSPSDFRPNQLRKLGRR